MENVKLIICSEIFSVFRFSFSIALLCDINFVKRKWQKL